MAPNEETGPAASDNRPEAASSLATLVAELKCGRQLEGLLHPALEKLAAYDDENQTDLLHTLRVYLDNDCNAQKCGHLLFLHRNSLVYRIRRVQEISGCDLSDPDERAYLRLSLLLDNAELRPPAATRPPAVQDGDGRMP